MKIKKIFKILFYNLCLLLLVYFLIEIISLAILTYKYKEPLWNTFKSDHIWLMQLCFPKELKYSNPKKYMYSFREPIIVNSKSNKDSIVLYGCSFAYGDGLKNEESFGGMLAKLAERNVYNRAIGGLGPQMMLYDLQTKHINDAVDNADYVIYLYMNDHINRMVMYRCWPFMHRVSVKYLLNKNRLEKNYTSEFNDEDLILKIPNNYQIYSFFYRLLEAYLPEIMSDEYKNELFYRIVQKSYSEAQKLYPNSKFIILCYSVLPPPLKKRLKISV